MTKHLTTEELQTLCARGQRPLRGAGAIGEHLIVCDECRAAYQKVCELPEDRSPIKLEWAGHEAFDEAHLDFGRELVPYAEGRLGGWELEVVEEHLAGCSPCAEDVAALRDVREEAELRAGTPHPTPDVGAANVRPRGWRQLLPTAQSMWPVFPFRKGAWAGVAALSIIIAAGAVLILMRRDDPLPQARQQQQPPTLREQTESPPHTLTQPTPQPAPTAPPLPGKAYERRKTVEVAQAARNKGGRSEADMSGRRGLPDDLRAEVLDAARTGSMRKPQSTLTELAAPPLALRGGPEPNEPAFALDEPAGVVVVSRSPVLRWQPLAGAESYTVTVLDTDFNEVAQSGPLNATHWRVARPLERGRVYSWQVSASHGGRSVKAPAAPAAPVKFKIMDARSNALIGRVKRSLDPLSLAVLYARVGALDEAARELSRIDGRSPDARSARRLLEQLQSWKRGQSPAPTRLNPAQ